MTENTSTEQREDRLAQYGSSTARHDAERAIYEWAALNRKAYEPGRRRAFNHEICSLLAGAGVPPLAATVTRIGRWGQSASVAEDVSQWYRDLAHRFNEREAELPLPAKQHANSLLEALWALARMETDQRLVEPLRQAADAGHTRIRELEKLIQQLTENEKQLTNSATESAAVVQRLSKENAALLRSIEVASDNHALAIDSARQQANLKEAQLAAAIDTLNRKVEKLQSELSAMTTEAQQHAKALEQRAAGERFELMTRLDAANQEYRRWQSLYQEVQSIAIKEKEQNSNLRVELATTAGKLELAQSQLEVTRQALATASDIVDARAAKLTRAGATDWLDRFEDALTVMCGAKPPREECETWMNAAKGDDGQKPLLDWVSRQHGAPIWSQSITTTAAAKVWADTPAEAKG